jgi:hypothetical protein
VDSFSLTVGDAYLSALAGNLEKASMCIEQVRCSYTIENSASMAAEVMLVEGVIHIYSGRPKAGVERLKRVVAIGDSAALYNLAALARGWLAVLHYNEGDVIAAGKVLSEALRFAEHADARTCLRISTVAGGLCEYSGLGESAAQWLLAAQRACSRLAVPGVLSSVVYDLALAAVDSAAAKKLAGKLSKNDANNLPLRVRSALNYDSIANVGVYRELHWLVLAMAYNICSNYGEAKLHLDRYFDDPQSFRAADQVCAYIELAIAQSAGGELDFDSDLIESIKSGMSLLVEPIERAVAFDILALNYQRLGLIRESQSMRERYYLEINRRIELSNSLELLISDGVLLMPPTAWTI